MPKIQTRIQYVVHKAEEGGYWAEVPALPGCFTQAETLTALRRNIREAVELYLEAEAGQPAADPAESNARAKAARRAARDAKPKAARRPAAKAKPLADD